jgi:hypothetical protein
MGSDHVTARFRRGVRAVGVRRLLRRAAAFVYGSPAAGKDGKRMDTHEPASTEVCAVCGCEIEGGDDVEDTNGWRWFNDGHGGLKPLCPTCPVPPELRDSAGGVGAAA